MKLSVDIKNAQGGYPYKYKRTPMSRLQRWEREAAELEAKLESIECAECEKTLLDCECG